MEVKKYTKTHEWIETDGKTATIGITNYAQEQLGDIVYVDAPAVDDEMEKGDTLCTIESVKSANDVYIPVSGKITAVNEELEDAPEKINEAAESDGWIVKVSLDDESELDEYMDEDDYKEFAESAE